jgi:hypothetical protein
MPPADFKSETKTEDGSGVSVAEHRLMPWVEFVLALPYSLR